MTKLELRAKYEEWTSSHSCTDISFEELIDGGCTRYEAWTLTILFALISAYLSNNYNNLEECWSMDALLGQEIAEEEKTEYFGKTLSLTRSKLVLSVAKDIINYYED